MSGGKTVAFQKFLFRLCFSSFFSSQKPSLKDNGMKAEDIVMTVSMIAMTFPFMMICPTILPYLCMTYVFMNLFKCLMNKNCIFYLPLGKSFIIRNIFLFSICLTVAFNVGFVLFIIILIGINDLVAVVFSGEPSSYLFKLGSYFLNWFVSILYSIIYIDGMMTAFFAKRRRIRIAIMIGCTLVCGSYAGILYWTSPKRKSEYILDFTVNFDKLPNNFLYGICLIIAAAAVTVVCIFAAERLNSPKRKTDIG